ncbi:Tat pathway signal protein [Rhizobium sp. CRIBSB]|nr:Tat pathway signal protein [Rhizobium sp. CRIBSB]
MERRTLLGLGHSKTPAPLETSGGGGGGSGDATFVRFPTVTGTVTRSDGRRGVMTVETGVDVTDAALRTRAQQSAPRLRAAYNAVVQRSAAMLLPGTPPDIERLARELQTVTDQTLGRAGARVLLGTVMVV